MPGTVWYVNASDYGHGDLLDEEFQQIVELTHFCSTADEVTDVYRHFIAGEIIAFLRGLNLKVVEPIEQPA